MHTDTRWSCRASDRRKSVDLCSSSGCACISGDLGSTSALEAQMRYLLLGFAAALVLGLANAPMARAFDTQIDDSTNADGSPKFADPDEQLDALADGGGGGSAYIVR